MQQQRIGNFTSAGINCGARSFYSGDNLVDSSEDEEGASPTAKRGSDGKYTMKFTRVVRRATLVTNKLHKFKRRSGETVSTSCKYRECNHFERIFKK